MTDPSEDAVWAKVQEMMPVHDCGERMQPGGNAVTGPLVLCTSCSTVQAVTFDWVDAKVAEAREVLRG